MKIYITPKKVVKATKVPGLKDPVTIK